MANCEDFKELAEQHRKTAEILMKAGDNPGAAYMLGYVLEFALKAAACKTLHLLTYPESGGNEKISSFFKAHNHDQLIMIAGLWDLFDANRGTAAAQRNWSNFTSAYLGEWTRMRYDKDLRKQFDKKKVKSLYNSLIGAPDGIIPIIDKNKRW